MKTSYAAAAAVLLLLNANDDVNHVVAPVDHVFVQTDVTELHVTDSGCMRDRDVIFCVLNADSLS